MKPMTDRPTDTLLSPAESRIIRKRQSNNARVTAILLALFVILTFAITIAKISLAN